MAVAVRTRSWRTARRRPTAGGRASVCLYPGAIGIETRGPDRPKVLGPIRRALVAVFTDTGSAEIAWARQVLPGQDLMDEHTGREHRGPRRRTPTSRAFSHYLQPSDAWSLVTPVVLTGYDDKRAREKLKLVASPPLRRGIGAFLFTPIQMYIVHMKRITASEARRQWFRLLDEVVEGEVVAIVRKGKRIIIRRENASRKARAALPDYGAILRVPDVERAHEWSWDWPGPDHAIVSVERER